VNLFRSINQIFSKSVRGEVPVENWGELFRCFVGPAARMNLKKLHLGIHFEMEFSTKQELDSNDTSIKAMKEAARQLGLMFEIEECGLHESNLTLGKTLKVIFKYPTLRKYALKSYKELLEEFITDEHLLNYFNLFCLWFTMARIFSAEL